MSIWIDLDNTPHVPFFIPIINALESRGHEILITARDAFQVCDLADRNRLDYVKIGHHYGKNIFMKLYGLFRRTGQLVPTLIRRRPSLALSHGSRAQPLLCNLIRIPSVAIFDYEHAKSVPFAMPRWAIAPEALASEPRLRERSRIRFYRGIKEDVYAAGFRPDPLLLAPLGLKPDDFIVTVRPPANQAHYYTRESDVLLWEFMAMARRAPAIRIVLLPRNRAQELEMRRDHPDWFSEGRTIVPAQAVDGLNLVWYSDLVVSGGGTMNREAAALGVPVYSVFRGTTGAVDRMLERDGRLTLIRSVQEVRSVIRLERRDKAGRPDSRPRAALEDILRHIEEIIRIERLVPRKRARPTRRNQ